MLATILAGVVLAGCASNARSTSSAAASSSATVPNGVPLTYAVEPYGGPVTPGKVQRTVEVLRRRLALIDVASSVQAQGTKIIVTLPGALVASRSPEAIGHPHLFSIPGLVTEPGRLYFYDWEPNVIGPSGSPAAGELTVTGGANAGAAQFGLPEYQAVLRAAKRRAILRNTDTTWQTGCTPQQMRDCLYGSWYLLDTKHQKVLCKGDTPSCQPAETEGALYNEGYKPPAGSAPKAVRVNPGTVLVQARPIESAAGKVVNRNPNSWYVLNDNPVLSGADITNPQQSFTEGEGESGQPNVVFSFDSHGQKVFQQVTKEIAQRGQEAQLPGVSKEAALQHFAVVLDGSLITNPSIDYTKYPEGIEAGNGSEISGTFTVAAARELAAELSAGVLPVRLVRVSGGSTLQAGAVR